MSKRQSSPPLHSALTDPSYRSGHLRENKFASGAAQTMALQDQYVANILKQIHFTELQIKLLKEKQASAPSGGVWALMQRSKDPLAKNAVDSSHKFQEMKSILSEKIYQLEADILSAGDQQGGTISRHIYLENRLKQIKHKRELVAKKAEEKVKGLKEKKDLIEGKSKILHNQRMAQQTANSNLTKDHQKMLTDAAVEKDKLTFELEKIKADQVIEDQIDKYLNERIAARKAEIQTLIESLKSDQDYQIALQQRQKLCKKTTNTQLAIANATFQMNQLTAQIEAAKAEKEKEVLTTKRLTHQMEDMKTMIKEVQALNVARREKQIQRKCNASTQIQKAREQEEKLGKTLVDIKAKLAKTSDQHKVYEHEVLDYSRILEQLRQKKKRLDELANSLTQENETQAGTLFGFQNEQRLSSDLFSKRQDDDLTAAIELIELEQQVHFLRGRKDYLYEALNLREAIDQARLEELNKVVQKNLDVNQTVGVLMSKWEEVKKFSRQ